MGKKMKKLADDIIKKLNAMTEEELNDFLEKGYEKSKYIFEEIKEHYGFMPIWSNGLRHLATNQEDGGSNPSVGEEKKECPFCSKDVNVLVNNETDSSSLLISKKTYEESWLDLPTELSFLSVLNSEGKTTMEFEIIYCPVCGKNILKD